MWRHLSNNVVLVPQQVDAVRAAWRVFCLFSVSVLATGLCDIMYAKFGCCTMLPKARHKQCDFRLLLDAKSFVDFDRKSNRSNCCRMVWAGQRHPSHQPTDHRPITVLKHFRIADTNSWPIFSENGEGQCWELVEWRKCVNRHVAGKACPVWCVTGS